MLKTNSWKLVDRTATDHTDHTDYALTPARIVGLTVAVLLAILGLSALIGGFVSIFMLSPLKGAVAFFAGIAAMEILFEGAIVILDSL